MGQLVRFGGTGSKHLVILHATGLLVQAYEPLAASLAQHYTVWGLDLPGHGTAAHCPAAFVRHQRPQQPRGAHGAQLSTTLDMPFVVQYVVDAVRRAGLAGCYAFGHSAGGSLALLAAAAAPGLFSAIYCFEAVVAAPRSHAMLNAAAAAGRVATSGQALTRMALRRRRAFGSRRAAAQQLAAKPPFAGLHPRCLELFLQHGLVEAGLGPPLAEPAAAAAAAAAAAGGGGSGAAATAALGDHSDHPQQQQQQPVQLVCLPELEAAYYAALDAPPAVEPGKVTCPVLLAVSALDAAGGGAAAAARFADPAAVQAWALEQQQPGQPGQALHAILAVFSCELAALMPTARLAQVGGGVSHFGPLEQPQRVAAACAQFLSTCPYLGPLPG